MRGERRAYEIVRLWLYEPSPPAFTPDRTFTPTFAVFRLRRTVDRLWLYVLSPPAFTPVRTFTPALALFLVLCDIVRLWFEVPSPPAFTPVRTFTPALDVFRLRRTVFFIMFAPYSILKLARPSPPASEPSTATSEARSVDLEFCHPLRARACAWVVGASRVAKRSCRLARRAQRLAPPTLESEHRRQVVERDGDV
jgi:hypothetical protein